jgi:hypothetical protein
MQRAFVLARRVARSEKMTKAEWDEFLPIIYHIWSLLSERGDDHVRGIRKAQDESEESWEDFANRLCEDSGLCRKTITRKIMEYRESVLKLSPFKSAPKTDGATTETEGKISEPIVDSDLSSIPHESAEAIHRMDVSIANFERPSEGASAEYSSEEILHHDDQTDWSSDSENGDDECALKPGNRSALTECVILNCDLQFNAVLAGLSASEKAKVLDYLTKHLVQRYLGVDRGDGEIKAGVEYIPPAPPQLRKEWLC